MKMAIEERVRNIVLKEIMITKPIDTLIYI